MNICFPSLSYPLNGEPTSGVGSQVRLLAHALIDNGQSVSVVDLANQPAVMTDDHGADVHRVTAGKLHWFIDKLPLIGRTLALPLREIEYSIAVWRGVRKANQSRKLDLIEGTETGMLLLALLWKKTPIIIRLHGEQYTFQKHTPGVRLTFGVRFSRVLQRVALRRARLLISPSYAHAREIHDELSGSHPPIVVVPNNVECGTVERDGHQRMPNSVLYAGRIEERKGIRTLLRAAAQTREAMPDLRFVFAGDFHSSLSESEFQQLVHANNLDGSIDLVGPLGWNVLADLYRRSAVAVLPSHYETFGLAALEPMAFGTPVIASDSSALPEVVVSEVNGKLVASGDANALAAAMVELLNDPKTCAQMGKAAIEHAAKFDVRNQLPVNERLYEWCKRPSWSEGKSHVFFSPHLDDAVLSCGGAIHALVSQSKSVQVFTVFSGDARAADSAFSRHLHAKWGTSTNTVKERRREDYEALKQLGVTQLTHWEYLEAPYRSSAEGTPLYGTYDELRGEPAPADLGLVDEITEKILRLDFCSSEAVLYFPLSLGRHADHQILFEVGQILNAAGKHVRFYEDYPYFENYGGEQAELNWLPIIVPISLSAKLKAISAYKTQLAGLGGSLLQKRLRRLSLRSRSGVTTERYWEFIKGNNGKLTTASSPLSRRQYRPRLRDFKKFLETFRWHDLDEVLPKGLGDCLDIGCGSGRHRRLIESRGYQWFGFDYASTKACLGQCDAASLPVQSRSKSAVVAWQVLEYVERPEQVIAEAARVLESGGVLCGSVSFLEPVHGRTFFNISPSILEKLLRQYGFADVEIKPGLNGFALMLWTWLRRVGIPFADRLAIPAAFLMFVPLSAVLFFLSWLSSHVGPGTGHLMLWLSQRVPLEFAGHIIFTARKRARLENCTSLS